MQKQDGGNTGMATSKQRRQPWHLLPIGVFYLLLNGIGLYDFILSIWKNAAYFTRQNCNEEQIAYFAGYPVLPAIFWATAIISGLEASLFLLFRKRLALPGAAIAVLSHLFLDIITFGFMGRWQVFGIRQSVFDLSVMLMMIGLLWYCKAMATQGVLR